MTGRICRGELGIAIEMERPVLGTTIQNVETIVKRLVSLNVQFESDNPLIALVKKHGIEAYYALMKGYLLSPEQLADEARLLESWGLDAITIMDSAGTMTPLEVAHYVEALKEAVRIPALKRSLRKLRRNVRLICFN